MSQSPETAVRSNQLTGYFQSWNALGEMLRRGDSFSGRERNCAFLNLGRGAWANMSAVSGIDFADDGRALALTDWDHDGDLDIWISNRTAPRVRFLQNEFDSGNNYLQIRLSQNTANSDAIGSRVEILAADGSRQMKTLRAGSGFVSQSTKWLHFGLGENEKVDKLFVRWPDGHSDEFTDIESGQRYVIRRGIDSVEGSIAIVKTNRDVNLPVGTSAGPSPDKPVRIAFTRRIARLELDYQDVNGQGQTLASVGAPVLVSLWASWCSNCMAELAELAENFDQLSTHQLSIVALCTDELSEPSARKSSSPLGNEYPFEFGAANAETLQKLSDVLESSLYRRRELPLPASFLFDRNGRLAIVYFGRMDVSQLVSDLTRLDRPIALGEAFPFPGRSGLDLFRFDPIGLAEAYEEAEYFDQAEQELVRYIVETSRKLDAGTLKPSVEIKRQLAATYQALVVQLNRQQRITEAKAVLTQALRRFPNSKSMEQLKQNTGL